jgi:hypothetical protein
MVDDKALQEWAQRELAKRLGLKKYKKYPAEPLRTLLSDPERREDLEMARGREEEWEAVLPYARLAYRVWATAGPRESFPQGGQVSERAAEQLGDDAAKRAQVFSECLAKLAAPEYVITHPNPEDPQTPLKIYPEVKGFRVQHLDDKLLSPKEARTLLTSPVAAHWPHLAFQTLGVPVVGHTYQVREGMSDAQGTYSLVEVPLPNLKVEPIADRRPLRAGAWELPEKREKARSNERLKREYRIWYGPYARTWKIVPYPGEDGRTHRVLVKRLSALGKLHDIVSRLIQRYPWEEPDAVWFVLTGETPQVAPLTWQARWCGSGIGEDSFSYGFVTLKIEPWVDPKLVWKVYTDIQRGLRGGRRIRRLEPKSLELLRFVNDRVNVADLSRVERRKKAPELVAAWNEENPDDSYNGNTREFWKAYHRARRAVMSPSYGWREEDSPQP